MSSYESNVDNVWLPIKGELREAVRGWALRWGALSTGYESLIF